VEIRPLQNEFKRFAGDTVAQPENKKDSRSSEKIWQERYDAVDNVLHIEQFEYFLHYLLLSFKK
jgi:hypothetical protein